MGKIGIPEHILNKPGRLTPSEFEIMKQHAALGAEILSVIDFPYPVVPIVRHHHENWDGTGYPDGLAGEAISIGARILQIVDCFDALTSDRPYRRRVSDADACQILADRKGTMYDPRIVDAFLALSGSRDSDAASAESAAGGAMVSAAARLAAVAPRALEARKDEGAVPPPLRSFFDIGRALGHSPAAADVGAAIWASLAAHLPATWFVLYVHEPESDALLPAFSSRPGAPGPKPRMTVGEGLSGWVAATGQRMVNADAGLDLPPAVVDAAGVSSALAVPARAEGRTVAVLTFYAPGAEPFSDRDVCVADAAADVVAALTGAVAAAGSARAA